MKFDYDLADAPASPNWVKGRPQGWEVVRVTTRTGGDNMLVMSVQVPVNRKIGTSVEPEGLGAVLKHGYRQVVLVSPLHPIAQYLLIQLFIAITLPIAGVIVAVGLDVAGIGTLLSQTSSPALGFMAMVAMSISMFAPMIFMTAVMLLAE